MIFFQSYSAHYPGVAVKQNMLLTLYNESRKTLIPSIQLLNRKTQVSVRQPLHRDGEEGGLLQQQCQCGAGYTSENIYY